MVDYGTCHAHEMPCDDNGDCIVCREATARMNRRQVDEIHDAARDRALRNMNPHAAAIAAMALYNERYAAQNGGSMDFWNSLTPSEKQTCADLARRIREARPL